MTIPKRELLKMAILFLAIALVMGFYILFEATRALGQDLEVPAISSCCVPCPADSGLADECHDNWSISECEAVFGIWFEGSSCADRDDCGEICGPINRPAPTMGGWFLIVLAVVLVVGGWLCIRRFSERFERMGPFR